MGAQPAVSYVDQLESRIVNVDRQLAALDEDFKAGKIVVPICGKKAEFKAFEKQLLRRTAPCGCCYLAFATHREAYTHVGQRKRMPSPS